MKKFIILGVLFAILAFGSFHVVWATHTVTGVTPSSIEQQATDQFHTITINLGGSMATPATSPLVSFKKGAISLAVSPVAFDVNNPSPSSWRVTIPAAGVAVGQYAVEMCLTFPAQPSHCTSLANAFRITLPGGGGGGPSPSPGGGFVEPVPPEFGGIPEGPQTGADFVSTVQGITNWVFVILLVFAVIFIVLAGFQFIAGGGDPQAVAQARQKLIWAAVGIAVALLAKGIPATISNLLIS